MSYYPQKVYYNIITGIVLERGNEPPRGRKGMFSDVSEDDVGGEMGDRRQQPPQDDDRGMRVRFCSDLSFESLLLYLLRAISFDGGTKTCSQNCVSVVGIAYLASDK